MRRLLPFMLLEISLCACVPGGETTDAGPIGGTPPNPRAEVYYSTGITYFLCQQLGLYKKMTSASTPVATRACELHPGARRTLQDFMDACRDVHLDVSCVSTGRAYLVAMQMLIRLQGDAFARSGSYVAPRIARAVLWAYGPVRRWGT